MRLTALTDGPLGMIVPLLVWGAHLLFVYGVLAVGCARSPETGGGTLPVLWLASMLAALGLVLLSAAQLRRLGQGRDQDGASWGERSLVLKAGPLISLIALVAVLWTALPLAFVAPCA